MRCAQVNWPAPAGSPLIFLVGSPLWEEAAPGIPENIFAESMSYGLNENMCPSGAGAGTGAH